MHEWDLFPLSLSSTVGLTILSQILAAVVADHLSYDQLENWRRHLRTRDWEQDGTIYQKWCKVKLWKPLIPDAGVTSPYQFRKKHLRSLELDYIHQFVLESVRAEITHLLTMLLAMPIILITPNQFVRWLVAYTLLMNLPCAIIQRYNRPRFEKILKRQDKGGQREMQNQPAAPSLDTYQEHQKNHFFHL